MLYGHILLMFATKRGQHRSAMWFPRCNNNESDTRHAGHKLTRELETDFDVINSCAHRTISVPWRMVLYAPGPIPLELLLCRNWIFRTQPRQVRHSGARPTGSGLWPARWQAPTESPESIATGTALPNERKSRMWHSSSVWLALDLSGSPRRWPPSMSRS